jgi:transcriptional regulator with XRE-family HTH domain
VDDLRVGLALRTLRRRRGLRQQDVAENAGLSQSTISLIECGHLESLSTRSLRAAFSSVEARYLGQVLWRGGALDRVLDERHASLVAGLAGRLRGLGWAVDLEVTYSHYGERGSIDVFASRRNLSAVLIAEVKSELNSVEETLRRLDAKSRLAPAIASERLGWQPSVIGRLLAIQAGSTTRRRLGRHSMVFDSAFPARGWAVRRWLVDPRGPISGLLLLPNSNGRGSRSRSRQICRIG